MNLKKVIDMTTFFLVKANGSIPYLKLMKLLYLSDRTSLEKLGYSMSEDEHYSMPYGPILSLTLDLIRNTGGSREVKSQWGHFFQTNNFDIIAKERSPLSSLSKSDTAILDEIWDKYKDVDKFELADFTHRFCPEWKDPGKSRIKIKTSDILEALDIDSSTKDAFLIRQEEQESIASIFKK
ncbi:MAG: hypothetical protein COW58_03780 [Thalassolituus sp. CG17_big_fil_post_rev_8_21_14_2_50_53_8]|nr:MAG: hypothetical protein COW58_03780 [Thalassolituus sp. CG17_big_fil_post_rev_8_21_14_2_50_53_8]